MIFFFVFCYFPKIWNRVRVGWIIPGVLFFTLRSSEYYVTYERTSGKVFAKKIHHEKHISLWWTAWLLVIFVPSNFQRVVETQHLDIVSEQYSSLFNRSHLPSSSFFSYITLSLTLIRPFNCPNVRPKRSFNCTLSALRKFAHAHL